MRTKIRKKLLLIIALIVLCASAGLIVSAEEEEIFVSGNYSYTINNNNEATLVGTTASGKLTLPSVIDGYTVVAIGDDFVDFNENITEVIIPESVRSIGEEAFLGCCNLIKIFVDESNKYYSSDDLGVLFDKDKTVLIQCPGGAEGDYTVPSTVKVIGVQSFYECKNITSVVMVEGLEKIEWRAFWDCYGITSMTVPSSVTEIEEGAFYGCILLNDLTFNANITSINEAVFCGCLSLTDFEISNKITAIGTYAFAFCGIEEIIIPDSVTVIASGAFLHSYKLKSVVLPKDLTAIYAETFVGCSRLESINIPNGVETIGSEAFAGCVSLTEISLGDNVTSIGEKAFYDCYSLQKVALGNGLKEIPDFAFDECYLLEEIVLGKNIESIGVGAFAGCGYIKNIVLPESVTFIGENAFEGLHSIENIYVYGTETQLSESMLCLTYSSIDGISYDEFLKLYELYVEYEIKITLFATNFDGSISEEEIQETNLEYNRIIDEMSKYNTIQYETPQPIGTIHCYSGSTAHSHAETYGIDYILFDDYESSDTITPDTTNRDDFTQQHLNFVNNANTQFYNYATSDFRFANTLWENMDSGVQNTAELVYDIIEGSVEVITFQAFDGLESIENPYDVILLDFLASETTQSFYEETVQEDAFTISVGIINDVIKMFDNDFAWAEDFDINKELKGLLNASDYSGNKLYEGLNTLFLGKGKKEVTAVFQGFECCGKILGNLSDGLSAIDCFVEMLRYTAAIEAYYNSSEVYKQVLKEIASEMYDVNENFAEKFNEALNTYTQCVSYDTIVESILEKGLDNGLSLVQDLTSDMLADATFSMIMKAFKVGGDMAGKINAALWAVDTGFSLSNMLTGNDTLVNCRRLLRANYMLDVASYNVMKVFETTLKNKESYGAATLFDNAFSFYKNVQIYSLNMYKTYCESSSTKWLSFKKKYFKGELEETVGRIKAWNNISCHYPTEETEKTITVDTVVIACPTDVYVYRKADNRLMASVVNNKSTIYNDDVTIMTLNGDKAIAVDWLENYRIEVKATDDGKMNVSYAKYQDLQCVNNSVFETVNITDGNTYILNTDNNTLNRDDGVIIHQNGDIEGCDCNCHASGIKKFFFNFILFFQKLFKKNAICDCGAAHY